MTLALAPVLAPQLARGKKELPEGEGWAYEPKYDGFRCIAFVDGDEVVLQSRGGKALGRYFPELVLPAGRYVIDGEIVIRDPGGGEDFDALSNRIHPAASRVEMLSRETPATYVAFDFLADGSESWLARPFAERRERLEAVPLEGTFAVTPLTTELEAARPWLRSGEGVIAKELGAAYKPGARTGMVKVKLVRTIDAVVAGWRPGKEAGTVGSLILGLYDAEGNLRIVGHSSGLKAAEKRALVERLAPYESGERGHGDASRWKSEKELEWVSLRPELVVEVSFDHMSGGRIRHGTKILRWREDKAPADCLLTQMEAG